MRDTSAMATPLTPDEKSAMAAAHPEWTVDGDSMSRTYEFADFAEAMGFVTRVALVAQAADHHPDIDVRWNKVALTLSTHSAGTLTSRDHALVDEIDGGGD